MTGLYLSWVKRVTRGLLIPGKQGQDFRENKLAVWGNQGDLSVAKVQAGAGVRGDEIEKVDV